jgi:drug/metabolite transporter (DMT)-like permease
VSQSQPLSPQAGAELNWTGLSNLFVVYLVWGSTYLAIRVAVRQGSGFPPFMMGAMRVLLGGALLLLWSALARKRIRLSRGELAVVGISGVLLWFGGNGLVVWAEQRAASGLAALMVSTAPLWVAFIQSVLDRRRPSWILSLALLTGFAGIGFLTVPVIRGSSLGDGRSVLALLVAALSWSLGSLFQTRRPVELTSRVSAGYQQLFGGAGFALAAWIFGEPLPTPSPQAWLAWGYLVVIASVFAFVAYVQALRLLPTNVVMTYAYVNPVIAVLLGWIVLKEPLTGWTLGGMLLVLLGVAGVFRDRGNQMRAGMPPAGPHEP